MKEQFKQLFILHTALLAGLLLFCGVAIFLNMEEEVGTATSPYNLIAPIVLFITAFAAYFLNEKKKKEPVSGGLQEKFEDYRARVILRSSLLEGSGLFAIIFYMLENAKIYLVYFAIAWLIMRFFKPSKDQFKREYDLSNEDAQQLNK